MSRADLRERVVEGKVIDGVLHGGAVCAVDVEHLVVVQGWRFLEVRCTGLAQRVALAPALHRRDASERADISTVRTPSTKVAAAELALTAATARTVAGRVIRKLGLRTSAQLPAFWLAVTDRSALRAGSWIGAGLREQARAQRAAAPLDAGRAHGPALSHRRRHELLYLEAARHVRAHDGEAGGGYPAETWRFVTQRARLSRHGGVGTPEMTAGTPRTRQTAMARTTLALAFYVSGASSGRSFRDPVALSLDERQGTLLLRP